MHAAFAEWLEHVGEGRDDHAFLLGHHYAEAVRPEDADLAWPDAEDELGRLRARASEWLAALRRASPPGAARSRKRLNFSIAPWSSPRTRNSSPSFGEIGRANALKYDGEAFWTAMQTSLKVCADQTTCGDTYSLLAFHTSTRSGMWMRRPEPELVEGWIEQALELSDRRALRGSGP